MCGIVGYIGNEEKTQSVLLSSMKRMEYRGYDSSGIAIVDSKRVWMKKKVGAVSKLEDAIDEAMEKNENGTIGIGHIRWATHGTPTEENAHPQFSTERSIYVVHNGIIENSTAIKNSLEAKGFIFSSATDTEVIANLIEHYTEQHSLEEAIPLALRTLEGTYAVAVVSAEDPNTLYAARKESPLLIGILNDGTYMVASDISALLPYTTEVIYLEDLEMAELKRSGHSVVNIKTAEKRIAEVQNIRGDSAMPEKEGYSDFMLKEIYEQPKLIKEIINRHVNNEGQVIFSGLDQWLERNRNLERLVLVACGSAAYAATYLEYILELLTGIQTKVEVGSEYRYKNPVIDNKTGIIVFSQSGETADTIASLRYAKKFGAPTIGIVNTIGSTIDRECDLTLGLAVGPEISVASTKAYSGMLVMGLLLALAISAKRGNNNIEILEALKELPRLIISTIEKNSKIEMLAQKFADYSHAYFLGRTNNYSIAREGAQKIKEIAYIHAEGYQMGELKHGPLALIDDSIYSVCIMPNDNVYEKNKSNLEEILARSGKVIVISDSRELLKDRRIDMVIIPSTHEILYPMLSTIVVQLFAYHTAVTKGCSVDKPRNLAKSVTVE